MGLLGSSSLFITPNGVKASKLYSVIPSDGSGDLAFTRSGNTATREKSNGAIETVLANVPRLDYTERTCPALLFEPQRTNLTTYSNTFSNVAWSKSRLSITANTVTSPDGTTNASTVTEDSTTATHYFFNTFATTIGTTYTYSIFAKANTRTKIFININSINASATSGAVFDLVAGTVQSVQSGSTAKIVNYGNGWYRCSYTASATVALYGVCGLYTTTSSSYTGDGVSGLYIYGGQLEIGTFPTSYIPTTTASVTRSVDAMSKTSISSLIGQTEGVLYWDVELNSRLSNSILSIKNTANTDFIRFLVSNNVIQADVINANTTTASISHSNSSLGRFKLAIGYINNNIVFYANGVLIGTDTNCPIPATTDISLSALNNSFYINAIGLWKTKLTNSELATLTTI